MGLIVVKNWKSEYANSLKEYLHISSEGTSLHLRRWHCQGEGAASKRPDGPILEQHPICFHSKMRWEGLSLTLSWNHSLANCISASIFWLELHEPNMKQLTASVYVLVCRLIFCAKPTNSLKPEAPLCFTYSKVRSCRNKSTQRVSIYDTSAQKWCQEEHGISCSFKICRASIIFKNISVVAK